MYVYVGVHLFLHAEDRGVEGNKEKGNACKVPELINLMIIITLNF